MVRKMFTFTTCFAQQPSCLACKWLTTADVVVSSEVRDEERRHQRARRQLPFSLRRRQSVSITGFPSFESSFKFTGTLQRFQLPSASLEEVCD